jgi:hypothetical protein
VDGRNALVVEPRNSEQICRSIRRILEDDSLRASLIANGLKSVRESFRLDQMIGALENCYLDAVRTSGRNIEWLVSEEAAKNSR